MRSCVVRLESGQPLEIRGREQIADPIAVDDTRPWHSTANFHHEARRSFQAAEKPPRRAAFPSNAAALSTNDDPGASE